MPWKELSGEERYRLVEMARKGHVPIKEICETFGLSRQTLHRAMSKADEAAVQALEPKAPGRKGKTPEEARVEELEATLREHHKALEQWKTKYQVALAFLELERKYDRGELDEPASQATPRKKTRARTSRTRRRRSKRKK